MIILKKYEIWYKNDINPNDPEYRMETVDSLIPYLNENIEIEEDVTLGDIFNHIEKEKELFDMVFSSHLGHFPIQLYIDDINKECPKDDESDLDYIELRWFYEYSEYNDEKYKDEINIFIDVSGVGDFKDDNGFYEKEEEKPEKMGYAIEFTQLRKMKNVPVRINKQLDIYEKNKSGPGKYDENIIMTGEKCFSVYDVFGELLNELSFGGSPEQRDGVSCKLCDIKEEMDKDFKNDPSSFKDLLKELKNIRKKNDKKNI